VARAQRPEALPPEARPVGQVIAEALRLYGDAFWRVLPLGLPVAVTNQVAAGHSISEQVVILVAATPLLTAAYLAACLLVSTARPSRRVLARAFGAGVLVIVPVPLLILVYVLPGLAWLAFVGLVVPVIVVEGASLRSGFARAVHLARADYVHALGSLAAATIVFGVTKIMLILLLRGTADAAERIALFLADLVLSPVLFLVPALVYFDQAARAVESAPRRRRRRHGDIHPALESDVPRRPDPEVEP
jgi:hypothetical protein